jgi:hypothetical protein
LKIQISLLVQAFSENKITGQDPANRSYCNSFSLNLLEKLKEKRDNLKIELDNLIKIIEII